MLGKGGFAKCYEITNIDNKRTYAAKIIPKNTLTKNKPHPTLLPSIVSNKNIKNPNFHILNNYENVIIFIFLMIRLQLLIKLNWNFFVLK